MNTFKKIKIAGIIGISSALALFLWASPASAQTGEVEVMGDLGTELGETTVTISGSGWDGIDRVYIIPCPGAEGNPSAINPATSLIHCTDFQDAYNGLMAGENLGVLNGVWTRDKAFELTQEIVDDGGLVVLVGAVLNDDPAFSKVVFIPLEGEAYVDGDDDDGDDDRGDLATTGANSTMLALIGGSVLLGGLTLAGVNSHIRKHKAAIQN